MNDWREYLTHGDILSSLATIQQDISNLHIELAFARQREVEAKASAWDNSLEGTVTGKERDARLAATPHTITILDLDGKKAALEEEKSFLLLLVNNGR